MFSSSLFFLILKDSNKEIQGITQTRIEIIRITYSLFAFKNQPSTLFILFNSFK